MKITLRRLSLNDQKQLASIANNPDVAKYLKDVFPHPYTCIDALNYLSYIQHKPLNEGCDFGIVVDDILVGIISTTFFDDIYQNNCEIGFWLAKEYWSKGIMSKALHLLLDDLFTNTAIQKIYAEIFAENIASQKVFIKNHFHQEAILKNHIMKNNQYHDVCIYSLFKDEYQKDV